MLDVGIKDLIRIRHEACPTTYNRSKNASLDCIFGSVGMAISKGRFLPFGCLQGDQRGVWVDIPTELTELREYKQRKMSLKCTKLSEVASY